MRTTSIALTIYLSLSLCLAAQSRLSIADQRSLNLSLQKIDTDHTTRYVAAFYDLDSDGTPEAIVYLISHSYFGTGGCNTLIFKRDKNSWRKVSDITVTRPPIRVFANKTNGWHDLGVWVQGGGIQPGYEAQLRFDGKTYPRNPSVLPAIKAPKNATGEIVIKSEEDALPLFPSH